MSSASAVGAVEQRGAPEACFLLVGGNAGYGKTRTGDWWSVQQNAVSLRIKAASTPHWVLTDLVRELGEQVPARTSEQMFAQAAQSLGKNRRPIVLDEVENALKENIKVLETIRDISDLVEVPVVLIGREFVAGELKRHRQLWTRISAAAEFGPATLEDVTRCCTELCEVAVDEGVVKLIHEQSEGFMREIVKAIKNVERLGKRGGGSKVTLQHVGNQRLTQEVQASQRRRAA